MKRCYLSVVIILASFFFTGVAAQTGTTTGDGKVNKTLNNTNQSIDNATNTSDKAKKTFDDISKMFKPKTPNEALVVIPGIEFEDENLEKLAAAIKEHKDVKKASVEYNEGTATINVVLKSKAGTEFWSDLPKELKDLFKMKSKKDNSILVFYKNAVQESSTEKEINNAGTSSNNTNEQAGIVKTENTPPVTKPAPKKQEQKKNQDNPIVDQAANDVGNSKPVQASYTSGPATTPPPASIKSNKSASSTGTSATVKTQEERTGNAGAIEMGFANPVKLLTDSSRFDGAVKAIVVQPDGKMIIGGRFNKYNDFPSSCIIRLDADGNIDKSFGVAMGFDGEVNTLVLQSDGKVIAGGAFTNYNGKGNPCNKIVRLNNDGSLDNSFNTGLGVRGTIEALALQPDGKLLAGGNILTFNNIKTSGLIRLNNDGSLDNSFNNMTGIAGDVYCIALSGGKIFAGGKIARYDKVFSSAIVKLNGDGSMDNSFTVNKAINGVIYTMTPMQNGKVIVAGDFNGYDKIISWNMLRLNADGSYDNSFTAPVKPARAYSGYGIFKMLFQQDGKIVIAGKFNEYNGTLCSNIARLNSDGSFDNSFQSGAGADMKSAGVAAVYTMIALRNGKILTAGYFNKFDETLRGCIALLNQNGKMENNFTVSSGFDRQVFSLAMQKTGKIIAAGEFRTYNGVTRIGLARLNPDGNLDYTYNIISGFNNDASINTVAIQPDDKIIAAGSFITYAGISRSCITRLNADGSIDNSFYVGLGFDNPVTDLVLQSDGKIVAIGSFRKYDGVPCEKIVRLNPDGRMDNSFQPGESFRGYVNALAVQPDGKIIAGGQFSEYNKTSAKNIIRINPDGSFDNSFVLSKDIDPTVRSITLQPDGKIILGGNFGLLSNIKGTRVIRLNKNGGLDTAFNWNNSYASVATDDRTFATTVQADGKIVVFGGYNRLNDNKPAARITRLNANGTLDNSFVSGAGFENGPVNALITQADGSLVAAGGFKSYNSYFTKGIVKIKGK